MIVWTFNEALLRIADTTHIYTCVNQSRLITLPTFWSLLADVPGQQLLFVPP
jgi:hypothetical protein